MLTTLVKILILEDFEEDAKLIRFHLESSGMNFESKLVQTKEDFEEALANYMPDAILCDHTLPQFDSIRALKMLRKSKRNIPFILVTGSVSEEFAVQMLHAGAHDYIIKDRLTRLPLALVSALQKCKIENERLKYFNDIVINEALFKKAEKIAHFGIWESDLINKITKWSDETFRILGYKVDEVIPSEETFMNKIHPEDKDRIIEIVRNPSKCTDNVKMDFRVVDKDMSVRHVESEFRVECNESGQPVKITGFDKDVTDRKVAAIEKKKIVEEFRDIYNKLIFHLENTPLGFIEWDNSLHAISWSKRAEEIFGWTEEEFVSLQKDCYSQVYKDDLEMVSKIAEQLLSGDIKRNTVTHRCYTKDGRVIWTEWFNSAQKDKNGKITSILSLVQDITSRINDETERGRISSDLFNRNRDLEQFTYIVSHNLRGPLANIMGFHEELMETDCTIEERDILRKELSNSVKNLDQVIKDLNEILNINISVSEKKEPVDFGSVVNSIITSILDKINKNEVSIITDFSEATEILSIKSYIHSIFYNLISNSIKYKKKDSGCNINITSFLNNQKLYLKFTDNGMGIDLKKNGKYLFGLYKRFHSDIEGKGIGLFMVKTHVEALNGKITVESEINSGTSFLLEFEI